MGTALNVSGADIRPVSRYSSWASSRTGRSRSGPEPVNRRPPAATSRVAEENGGAPRRGERRSSISGSDPGGGLQRMAECSAADRRPTGSLGPGGRCHARVDRLRDGARARVEAAARLDLSNAERKDLEVSPRDKRESSADEHGDRLPVGPLPGRAEGLAVTGLAVPATKDERIVSRVVDRLADQNYGQPKILRKMGASTSTRRSRPGSGRTPPSRWTWRSSSAACCSGRTCRSCPSRRALRDCIRDADCRCGRGRWRSATTAPAATGNSWSDRRIWTPSGTLFDGTASLVKGDLLADLRGTSRRLRGGRGAGGADRLAR